MYKYSKDVIDIIKQCDNYSDFHRRMGEYFGYNKCCIDFFVTLSKIDGIPIGYVVKQLYGKVPNSNHVLCPRCIREYIKENGTDSVVKYPYEYRKTKYLYNDFYEFKQHALSTNNMKG